MKPRSSSPARCLFALLSFSIAVVSGLLAPMVEAGTHSAESNLTTVDTRGTNITVSGRVLHAVTRSRLAGAAVVLAGQTATTSGSGEYAFASVSLSSGNTLAVSKTGFATSQTTVAPPAGATRYTVPDVFLSPTGQFAVTRLQPKYDGLFLSGAAILNEYTATVSWGGRTPGAVEFYVNGSPVQTVSTTTGEATAEVNMAFGFFGSLTVGANKIQAVAVDSLGERSEPFKQAVTVIPTPSTLDLLSLPFELMPGNDPGYRFKVQVPPTSFPASAIMPIPWFDKVGLDLAGVAELKYRLLGGQWDFRGGVKAGSPKLSWGGWKADLEFTPEARGVASQTRGFDVDQVGLKFRFDAKYPILVVYVFDLVPGGQVLHVIDVLVLVGVDVNSIQRLLVNGLFRFDADLLWSYHGLRFSEATVTPGGGVQALYAPSLLGSSLELDVTGRLNFPWRLNPPMAWKVSGEVSFGLNAKLWGMVLMDSRWILLSGEIASSGNWAKQSKIVLRALAADGTLVPIEGVVVSLGSACPRPMDRDYLKSGPEQFVAQDPRLKARAAEGTAMSPLEAFRAMGQGGSADIPVRSAGEADKNVRAPKALAPATAAPSQADLPVLQNVFPNSQPALAGRGQELMLLYVTDNGASNALQFTDIKWTRFDGTNWSVPATIHANTQAEFSPQVTYDGNGDAIAVWERVADANFNQTNL
ncbi:MAG: carboxypeptidase-like regulatory domain-containing protein, partial [Verrucomicrobiota bacterium]